VKGKKSIHHREHREHRGRALNVKRRKAGVRRVMNVKKSRRRRGKRSSGCKSD
jgi:hypothetical protein